MEMMIFFMMVILLILFLFLAIVLVEIGKNDKNYIWKWLWIVILIAIMSLVSFKIIGKEWIPPQNAVKSQAKVLQIGDYIRKHRKKDSMFGIKRIYYQKNIMYSYTVEGVEYVEKDVLESTNREYVEKFEENIIQITYNSKQPDNVVIGNPDYTRDVLDGIVIIFFIVIAIVGNMGSTPLKESEINGQIKKKGKYIILKVIKIEFIDYEREKVFFEDEEKNIYYYETDFGEDFQVDKKYQIKLNRYNQEKSKIEYRDNKIKAIKIVKTEKNEFINF